MNQLVAVVAEHPDSYSVHRCMASCCNHCYHRSIGNGQHYRQYCYLLNAYHQQPKNCYRFHRLVAAAVDDDDEAVGDCYKVAVAEADNADNVTLWSAPYDRFSHRVPVGRNSFRRHPVGNAAVIVDAVVELPVDGNVAVGSILDDSVDYR